MPVISVLYVIKFGTITSKTLKLTKFGSPTAKAKKVIDPSIKLGFKENLPNFIVTTDRTIIRETTDKIYSKTIKETDW